jgi:hypothetical protein
LSACEDIEGRLQQVGYAHLPDTDTFSLFGFSKGDAWDSFAASWNNLGTDLYMDDGGRYRRRRHATFQVINGVAERQPGFVVTIRNQQIFSPIPEGIPSELSEPPFSLAKPCFNHLKSRASRFSPDARINRRENHGRYRHSA